ncbi:hypothetical protein Syun_014540 [Stephania yunnanensis]|uniref:Glycoside hydrolase family 31 TIM barrel domain-containing protein n=1 Tax=Stephania yunnanensis TaxID=152371 RepID=A0AAP0JLP7_9MAGN
MFRSRPPDKNSRSSLSKRPNLFLSTLFSLLALWSLSLTANRLLTALCSLSGLRSPVTGHRSLLSPVTALSSVIFAHRSLLSLLFGRSVLTAFAHSSLLVEDVLSLSHRSRTDDFLMKRSTQYCLNLKEHVPSRRSTRLTSRSKHGQKFSGTEITLCTYENINNLIAGFTCFLQKVQHASHVFGSVSRVVEGNRWMFYANLKNSFIKYVSDLDQRLVADCNLMDLDTVVVADRRGHFAVLSSKNHFECKLAFLFPNPKALVNELYLNGFKAIWMLDPGIKHEEGYFVYDSGSKEDVWIQNVDGKPFVGKFKFPLIFPSTLEVSNLISASEEQYYKIRLECHNVDRSVVIILIDLLSSICVQLTIGVVQGTQWLHNRVEVDGYKEYSEVEYSPAGCTGEYTVIE